MKNKILDISLDLISPAMDFIYSLLNDENIPENIREKAKQFLKDYENKIMSKLKSE